MEYWKKIELDNLDIIKEKSLDYIKTQTHHFDRTKYRGPFINLDRFKYIQYVPEIAESFRKHGLFFEDANIFLMWDNKDCVPHKDYTDSIARINIPLLNCEGTFTTFYKNLKSKRLLLPTGVPFYVTMNKDYEEIDRMPFESPAIVRISEGHSVIMNETKFPRITLSLSCNPDPGLLLED